MIAFRLSRRSDLRTGSDTYSITLTVSIVEKRDAAKQMTDEIGRSGFEHYAKIAAGLKAETGKTIYLERPFRETEIDFEWQSNRDTPNDFYACHIRSTNFTSGAVELLGRIARAADLKNRDYLYLRPRDLIAALHSLKAVPMRYLDIGNSWKFIIDADFQAELDKTLPLPAAEETTAAA